MKIRNGFVSNSSTSSFILFGHQVGEDERENLAKRLGLSPDAELYGWDYDEDDPEKSEMSVQEAIEAIGGIDVLHEEYADEDSIFIGPCTSIEYVEDLTDFIKSEDGSNEKQLSLIEEKLGLKVEDARYLGIKAGG
jgi:hypothetical protein